MLSVDVIAWWVLPVVFSSFWFFVLKKSTVLCEMWNVKSEMLSIIVIAGHGLLKFWGLGGGILHKVRALLQWDPEARCGFITLTPFVPRYNYCIAVGGHHCRFLKIRKKSAVFFIHDLMGKWDVFRYYRRSSPPTSTAWARTPPRPSPSPRGET